MNEQKEQMSKGFWWCPECKQEVDGTNVTFEEFHDACGTPVEFKDGKPGGFVLVPRELSDEKDYLAVRKLVQSGDGAEYIWNELVAHFTKPNA